jgi:hypothetical protein
VCQSRQKRLLLIKDRHDSNRFTSTLQGKKFVKVQTASSLNSQVSKQQKHQEHRYLSLPLFLVKFIDLFVLQVKSLNPHTDGRFLEGKNSQKNGSRIKHET